MAYLGSWNIDSLMTFPANTHRFDTGVATDADSAPSYRVYEDETGTPILTGSMALLDSSNTAGFYSEQLSLTAGNGFERGKSYTIYISATVNAVTGTMSHTFQVGADVVAERLGTQAKADVNAEVVDVMATDTYAEPGQATPAATASLAAKLNYLFKAWRNRSTQSTTEYNLYNSGGAVVDQQAMVSDNGTQFDRGEVATGP